MGKYKRHSQEYIRESVHLITHDGWTQLQVAKAADVHVNTVAKWVSKARQAGSAKDLADAKDRRIKELETENKKLERELAFSKKVAAWLATLEEK